MEAGAGLPLPRPRLEHRTLLSVRLATARVVPRRHQTSSTRMPAAFAVACARAFELVLAGALCHSLTACIACSSRPGGSAEMVASEVTTRPAASRAALVNDPELTGLIFVVLNVVGPPS